MQSLTEEERIELAKMMMSLFDHWKVSAEQRKNMLGLPDEIRSRQVQRFGKDMPLPEDAGIMERVEHLLGISSALRTTYPTNANMAPIWLRKPHRRFDQRTPLDTMLQDGLSGLISVRAHLDCSFAWNRSVS